MVKNKSFVLLCAVGVSMAAVGAIAAIPGVFPSAPLGQGAVASGPRVGLSVVMDADPGETAAPAPEAPQASQRPFAVAQISALPPTINPIAYGSGETGASIVLNGEPSPIRVEGRDDPAPAGGLDKAFTLADGDDQLCLYDEHGRRQAVPLEKLVLILRAGIAAAGPTAQTDDVRTLIQSDLNRSGDTQKVKVEALQQLMGLYPTTTAAGRALQQPFDLADLGFTEVNGYDPCANPAATGPSGFGRGPFADTFSTINPMPVVAARSLAVTEGGGA